MGAIIVNLECITNMHVGSGDVNFNIIDNEVERDVVTGYPTINASGVKGALREYFTGKISNEELNAIFGKEESGKLKMLTADMLAVPMRASAGGDAYYLVTTEKALEMYEEKYALFMGKALKLCITEDGESKKAEGIALTRKTTVLDKTVYVMEHKDFEKVSLPVIARNKLDNGKSVNLWYEEVVPHKSLFTFVVLAEDADVKLLELFKTTIAGKIVQFGGNASIGYGLCKVTVTEVA